VQVQAYIDAELQLRCQLDGLAMTAAEEGGDLGELAQHSTAPCGVTVGPDDIGTLSFTSGSTGIPKAVRGRHISLTHFYPWMAEEFGIGRDDRFSMLSGIAHDPIQVDWLSPPPSPSLTLSPANLSLVCTPPRSHVCLTRCVPLPVARARCWKPRIH